MQDSQNQNYTIYYYYCYYMCCSQTCREQKNRKKRNGAGRRRAMYRKQKINTGVYMNRTYNKYLLLNIHIRIHLFVFVNEPQP